MMTYQLDHEVVDAADLFATLVMAKFPAVRMTFEIEHSWRPSWVITLPSAMEVEPVEKYALELSERFYWEKGVYISYWIERQE